MSQIGRAFTFFFALAFIPVAVAVVDSAVAFHVRCVPGDMFISKEAFYSKRSFEAGGCCMLNPGRSCGSRLSEPSARPMFWKKTRNIPQRWPEVAFFFFERTFISLSSTGHPRYQRRISRMVCDKCEEKLSKVIVPDKVNYSAFENEGRNPALLLGSACEHNRTTSHGTVYADRQSTQVQHTLRVAVAECL